MNIKTLTTTCLLRYPTFFDLFTGKWQSHYQSQSEADLALLRMIADCGGNRCETLRIFNQSALGQRDKWKKRVDYRRMTMAKVFNTNTTTTTDMETKCPKCNHEWDYSGKLQLATCPSCGIKVKHPKEKETKK